MTHTVAIVQARMGSTRLPGKVLMDISGKPMLWHVINRLKKAKSPDKIVVATSTNKEDRQVIKVAADSKVASFTGSIDDVLDRFYQAASLNKADVIIRITADCPLIDPKVVDKIAQYYKTGNYDYVSNNIKPTYPDGLDTEVFSFKALERAWREARLSSEREHVTPYIWKNPGIFNLYNVESDINYSHLRWTVDDSQDMELIREIYRHLYNKNKMFYMEDTIKFLEAHPDLLRLNRGAIRNAGYIKSVAKDRIIRKV